MNIATFPTGPFETNAYVVSCPATHQAAIIDPGVDSAKLISDYLTDQNLNPACIWLTHSHWDHIAEVAELKKKYSIPVAIHFADIPNLKNPGSDGLPCWIPIQGVTPDMIVDEGMTLTLGKLVFSIIHTPGHSPGSICLYCPEQNLLISGDTLFKGTIGNLSFPTSEPDKMWDSLEKLAKLPPSTQVFPGHGPSTTIGQESWLSNAKNLFDRD